MLNLLTPIDSHLGSRTRDNSYNSSSVYLGCSDTYVQRMENKKIVEKLKDNPSGVNVLTHTTVAL